MKTKEVIFVDNIRDHVWHICPKCSAPDVERDCPVRDNAPSGIFWGVSPTGYPCEHKYNYSCKDKLKEPLAWLKFLHEIEECAKNCKYNTGR